MAVLEPTDQETLRAHVATSLDGRDIENLLVRAETREVEPIDGYRRYEPTGRRFIEITTVPHPEIPEPEMALPRWPSISEMNPAHLFGEADETTAYHKE